MRSMTKFVNKLKVRIFDDALIIEEVSSINIHRIYILSLVMMPIHLAHIMIFYLNTIGADDTVNKWRLGIIIAHSAMFIMISIVGAVAYRIKQQKIAIGKSAYIIQTMISLSYLIFGVIVCSIDQLVASTINPYLMACAFNQTGTGGD